MVFRAGSRIVLIAVALVLASFRLAMADDSGPVRTDDVIYGRKHGVALTMDVFTPRAGGNGAAVVWVVSGGWISADEFLAADSPLSPVGLLTDRGYTVFAVVHGSQPKYTVPEILEDLHRAVRFIRTNADRFSIDPDRIGITGASAGGHLSLMQGTAGTPGDRAAKDPVDRASSRVQAVACFFPPTDFLNYGAAGIHALRDGILKDFRAPFAFHDLDRTQGVFGLGVYVPITDEKRIDDIFRRISPVTHVTRDDAPTLIIHGDADKLVPLQQAEIIIEKFKAADVPAELVVKPGAAHGWADLDKDWTLIADWFDKHLQSAPKGSDRPGK